MHCILQIHCILSNHNQLLLLKTLSKHFFGCLDLWMSQNHCNRERNIVYMYAPHLVITIQMVYWRKQLRNITLSLADLRLACFPALNFPFDLHQIRSQSYWYIYYLLYIGILIIHIPFGTDARLSFHEEPWFAMLKLLLRLLRQNDGYGRCHLVL